MKKEDQEYFQLLWKRYLSNEASPDEVREFMQLLKDQDEHTYLEEEIATLWETPPQEDSLPAVDWGNMYSNIVSTPVIAPVKRIYHWWKAVAAVFFLLIAGGLIWQLMYQSKPHDSRNLSVTHDIAGPSVCRAVLTLTSGEQLKLDRTDNGVLATEGITTIEKPDSNCIVYHKQSSPHNYTTTTLQYNTLTVPKGSKFIKVQLEDGTRVTLNAASTLIYPVAFTDSIRAVILNGEGFFEVAKETSRRFLVTGGGVITEVLGTHFNIKAYRGEETKVTLAEGKVKISNPTNGDAATIYPGQQVRFNKGIMTTVDKIDVEAVNAWVHGYFTFAEVPLPAMMQELCRAYDLQVQFKDAINEPVYLNNVPANTNLSTLLKALELTKIARFTIKGDVIEVSKYN